MLPMFRPLMTLLGILFAFSTLLSAGSEFKYSYFPKKVYKNQVFPVTVIALDTNKTETLQFEFDTHNDVHPLFEKPLVIKSGSDSFYTFYFKAKDEDVRMPPLTILSSKERTVLPGGYIPLKELEKRDDFCGVLAAEMKIKNSQVSNYDEKSYIITLNIEANEANLEDMALSSVQESGIEEIHREYAKVRGNFYVVVPAEQKELNFTYYNTIKQQYNSLQVPITVIDATNVTHSDLNPKEDSFDTLKKYLLISLSVFFLLMFLFKRDFFYLVLTVISFITLLTLFIPHEKVCVKQGAPLYILPTKTSTVSTYIDKHFETIILSERDPYIKIEYKEGIVGWIKNEDICEN